MSSPWVACSRYTSVVERIAGFRVRGERGRGATAAFTVSLGDEIAPGTTYNTKHVTHIVVVLRF